MTGSIPPFLAKLETRDGAWFSLAAANQEETMKPGALDAKTKLLISLAVDAYAGSTGVRGIAEAARRNGASEGEILESLRVAALISQNRLVHAAMGAFE